MSIRSSIRRWRYRRSAGVLDLPVRPLRRSDEPIGPVTSITPPKPSRSASQRTGTHLGIRVSVTMLIVGALFCVLLVRLWSIQVVQGPQLNSDARQEIYQTVQVLPPRGEIVTRDGMVLAGDNLEWQVQVARNEQTAHPGVIKALSSLIGMPTSEIISALTSLQTAAFAPVTLPTNAGQVTQADALYIKQNAAEFPGVTVDEAGVRFYPQHSLASQVIGYVHPITAPEYHSSQFKGYPADAIVGQSGLEEQYERYLQGTPGKETYAVDPLGQPVGKLTPTPAVAGDAVVLNMDSGLEQAVSNALSNQLENLRATGGEPAPWGAVVVMNMKGAVLAMTSEPGYDNNVWEPSISNSEYANLNPAGCNDGAPGVGCPLANYAISGLQPPGSTFKLATATAALDDGLITPGYYYDDTGTFTVGDQTFHDSDNEALGEVNVTSALSESSDIFFYNLGYMFWQGRSHYGVTPIQRAATGYGLGVASGIDLPNSLTGQVDSPQLRLLLHKEAPAAYPSTSYYAGDNVELAFGQGETLVSPLELAEAYGTFANGGTRYAPEVAAAIVNPSGAVVQRIEPKVMDRVVLPPSTREPMLAGFEGAVQSPSGTAYAAFTGFNFSNFLLAGKTGTATTCPNDSCPPTSWFVSFGGAGSTPQYVVAVEVNEGGFGAAASAPVARQVWNYLEGHPVGKVDLPS